MNLLFSNKKVLINLMVGLLLIILGLLFSLQILIKKSPQTTNEQKTIINPPITKSAPENREITPTITLTPSPLPPLKITWPTPSITVPFSDFKEGK